MFLCESRSDCRSRETSPPRRACRCRLFFFRGSRKADPPTAGGFRMGRRASHWRDGRRQAATHGRQIPGKNRKSAGLYVNMLSSQLELTHIFSYTHCVPGGIVPSLCVYIWRRRSWIDVDGSTQRDFIGSTLDTWGHSSG